MKCDPSILKRMKRLQGQVSGIIKMMESERDCEAIVTQLSSVSSNVEKTIKLITTSNLIQSIEKEYDIVIDKVDKELDLLVKSK